MSDTDLITAVMKLASEVQAMKTEVRGDIDRVYDAIKVLTDRHNELSLLIGANQEILDRRVTKLEKRSAGNGYPGVF